MANLTTTLVASVQESLKRKAPDGVNGGQSTGTDSNVQPDAVQAPVAATVKKARIWMIKVVPRAVDNRYGISVEFTSGCFSQCGAMSSFAAAMDNCAKCSASNMRADFLWLDESAAAKSSIVLVGIGGEAQCGGRGPMVLTVQHNDSGTWVIIDPGGIFIGGTSEGCLRIVAANKLEKGGLVIMKQARSPNSSRESPFRSCLVDTRTNSTVLLTVEDGIQMLPTVNRSASNYRKHKAIKQAVPLIEQHRHSPLVHMNTIDAGYQKAAQCNSPFSESDITSSATLGATVTLSCDAVGTGPEGKGSGTGIVHGGQAEELVKADDPMDIVPAEELSNNLPSAHTWLTGVEQGTRPLPGTGAALDAAGMIQRAAAPPTFDKKLQDAKTEVEGKTATSDLLAISAVASVERTGEPSAAMRLEERTKRRCLRKDAGAGAGKTNSTDSKKDFRRGAE